ncbi:MAG: hypothetical protein ACFB16_23290 [Phormidesmis sp.]
MNDSFVIDHSFEHLDEILKQHSIEPLSLNPHKALSTSFSTLGNTIVKTIDDPFLIDLFRDTLASILESILMNFPNNIFWDFDFFVGSMLKQTLAAERSEYFLQLFHEKIELLMALFGNRSKINFRYLHDFIYGFDWAKWVKKEPQSRCSIAPFDLFFLDYLIDRGHEILQLIDMRDRKYHQLHDGSYRNPFCFSREPKDEISLFICLASRNLIPVTVWEYEASPIWNKPFYKMRETISVELFLTKKYEKYA